MKWYDTITHRLRGGAVFMQTALLLVLSLIMSACLIIEIEITEEVDANGLVTVRIVVQEDEADVNAARGVQMLLVPQDWVFNSGTYDASDANGAVGNGEMVEEAMWADSAALGVYPAPAGMKWVGLVSDMAYAHGATLIMETEVEFTAGATGGTFPVGIVVTKESYHPSNGDWFATGGSTIVGADSAMVNLVTVNASGPQRVTFRELNTIPQAELDSLAGLGEDLTGTQNSILILPDDFLNDTVAVTAVLASDPFTSGRATWLDSENRPGRIHLWFVDTTANSQGREGMGFQVVDGDFPNTGSLDLQVGDVVDMVAVVTNFFQTVQMTPLSYQVIGTMEDFGLDAEILEPISILTSDVNVEVGDGTFQPNYSEISNFLQSYVVFENVTVISRTIANTGRPDFAVSHDGGDMSLVDMSDSSLRYRNDQAVYADGGYNARASNDPFVPPPPGSVINLKGYIVAQGDDPNGLSLPAFSMLNIMPWEDSDIEVVESPPVPGTISRPDVVPGVDPVPVTIDIEVDPARTLTSAVLKWAVGPDPEAAGMVEMTNTEGVTYTGEVPALDDGSIVRYWVEATDNQDATSLSAVASYRVLVDGINSIADIQETFDAGSGPSPLAGFTTDMDFTAVVQTRPDVSGILAVQDNADLEGWSGILLELDEAATALALAPGDSVRVTAGTISEVRGDLRFDRGGETTAIVGPTIEKISTGKTAGDPLGYKEVSTDVVADAAVAEAHESMLLSFANVLITNNDNGFGEFRFQTVGDAADAVADDASQSLPGGPDLFAGGEVLAFVRGFWDESFGTYRLLPEDDTDIGEVTNVAIEPIGEGIPGQFTLNQNYPNPFNPSTTITYDVGVTGHVRIDVFDVTGRLVETLVDEQQSAGAYRVTFDAGSLTSGIYLYRMSAGDQVLTQRMLLVK